MAIETRRETKGQHTYTQIAQHKEYENENEMKPNTILITDFFQTIKLISI